MNITLDTRKIKAICEAHDISYLGLFGSYAIGKERIDSDIDLLVDFKNTKSLLQKGKAIMAFQDLFKKEIDLVTRKNLKPELKPFIDSQLISLYEEKQ